MRVLIACEFSGIVKQAFQELGHDAWSCDIVKSEIPENHLQCDVREVLNGRWDLMIAHPPCTHLARSGARWWVERRDQQDEAIEFVKLLAGAEIPKIVIENPIGCLSTRWKKPTQIVEPYHFGHMESKKTCLWIKGLPKLRATQLVNPARSFGHYQAPSIFRQQIRSRTNTGMARAMAEQWGGRIS